MSDENKLELLADVFDCEAEDLSPETKLSELENWDSMTMLSLIVMVDDECHKTLTRAEIAKFKTVGDILNYMAE